MCRTSVVQPSTGSRTETRCAGWPSRWSGRFHRTLSLGPRSLTAWIFGIGHRVDCCVVKVINLLARFGLHEPVENYTLSECAVVADFAAQIATNRMCLERLSRINSTEEADPTCGTKSQKKCLRNNKLTLQRYDEILLMLGMVGTLLTLLLNSWSSVPKGTRFPRASLPSICSQAERPPEIGHDCKGWLEPDNLLGL
ncbi:hypothetical protein AGLY_004176, partial [Aphis glycines]